MARKAKAMKSSKHIKAKAMRKVKPAVTRKVRPAMKATAMKRRVIKESPMKRRRASSGKQQGFASVDGVRKDPRKLTVSVWDLTVQRGFGVFEVIKLIKGASEVQKPRHIDLHLTRIRRSAEGLNVAIASDSDLERWLRAAAAASPSNGMLRVLCTGGSGGACGSFLGMNEPCRTVILWEPLPASPQGGYKLQPMVAPWHPAGAENWETIKWLSYAQNLRSTALAKAAGFNDAILTDRQGRVLDGPNFGVAWLSGGTFKTPSWRELGMLQSTSIEIVMRAARKVEIPVDEGTFDLERDLLQGDVTDVFAFSTTKDMQRVTAIGSKSFSPSDSEVAARLRKAFLEESVR